MNQDCESLLNKLETRMKEYYSLCTQLLENEDAGVKNEIVGNMLECVGMIQNYEYALEKRFGLKRDGDSQ